MRVATTPIRRLETSFETETDPQQFRFQLEEKFLSYRIVVSNRDRKGGRSWVDSANIRMLPKDAKLDGMVDASPNSSCMPRSEAKDKDMQAIHSVLFETT